MKIKTGFIVSAYNAEQDTVKMSNVLQAREIAIEIAIEWWGYGVACICPQMNSFLFGGIIPEIIFYEGYQELLLRSDVVIIGDNIDNSKGCKIEMELAKEQMLKDGRHIFQLSYNHEDEMDGWFYLNEQKFLYPDEIRTLLHGDPNAEH